MKFDTEVVIRHLAQTLASPLFRKAERQARFLRFVVDAALHTPEASLKEFDIGTAVYDRRSDFDPRADPIVRVEASRLRARLREHYETTPPDTIKIELPKGGYVPHFIFLEANPEVDGTGLAKPVSSELGGGDRSIAIQSFRSLSEEPDHQHFCDGLTEELLHKLTEDGRMRIIAAGMLARLGAVGGVPASRYLLEGSVRRSGDQIRLTLHLVDLSDGGMVLSKIYPHTIDEEFAAQERIAQVICGDVVRALASGGN